MWPFKKNTDKFRLDLHREVLMDGKPFVIIAFSADGSFSTTRTINVTFERSEDFMSKTP